MYVYINTHVEHRKIRVKIMPDKHVEMYYVNIIRLRVISAVTATICSVHRWSDAITAGRHRRPPGGRARIAESRLLRGPRLLRCRDGAVSGGRQPPLRCRQTAAGCRRRPRQDRTTGLEE